jgi:hypothetical protein
MRAASMPTQRALGPRKPPCNWKEGIFLAKAVTRPRGLAVVTQGAVRSKGVAEGVAVDVVDVVAVTEVAVAVEGVVRKACPCPCPSSALSAVPVGGIGGNGGIGIGGTGGASLITNKSSYCLCMRLDNSATKASASWGPIAGATNSFNCA